MVLVDTVVPMSPAYRADLRRDDVVLAIDNKPVNNVAQVSDILMTYRNVTIIQITIFKLKKVLKKCLKK